MAEFVEGFERLAAIRPSVSIFGSARFGAEHPYSKLAEEIGYRVIGRGFLGGHRRRAGDHGGRERVLKRISGYLRRVCYNPPSTDGNQR